MLKLVNNTDNNMINFNFFIFVFLVLDVANFKQKTHNTK
jgi:hypothetical protein